MTTRSLAPSSLITLTTIALAACSPVVLPAETETEGAPVTDSGTAGETAEETGAPTSEGGEEGGPGEDPDSVPTACVDLVPRVLGVFEADCAKCHDKGGPNAGGMDYIMDLDELIATKKVVPKDPENSPVYKRMTSVESPMPPLTEERRPTANDITSVGKWIDECAGVQSCADQQFITNSEVLTRVSQDLSSGKVGITKLKFTRYFSFVHLHNAGWCDAEIEPFRQALSKLVNSLSQEVLITAPEAIDEQRLIFRIDISLYKWQEVDPDAPPQFRLSEPTFYFRDGDVTSISDEEQRELDKRFKDKWDMIADQNPYNIRYLGQLAEKLILDTDTEFPIMQGDSFIDVASRSPLYYDILDIPLRSGKLREGDPDCIGNECLETQLGVEILGDIADEIVNDSEKVGRAAFRESLVSDFNRVIERHRFQEANNRVFWISYDFAGQTGLQNVNEHPLDFEPDGGEIIFNLPNGLQAYMLTNAVGDRLNEGPLQIVQDESQDDFLVRNGVSCMGCHQAGMITASDDVRFNLDMGQVEGNFNGEEIDAIKALYPERTTFDSYFAQDTKRFQDALVEAGVDPGTELEPIITTFLSFDEDVGLRRAASELGMREDDLASNVGKLSPDLSDLATEGGNVQRKDFTATYAASACILNLGLTRCCPNATNENICE
jgi:hypothetical protein